MPEPCPDLLNAQIRPKACPNCAKFGNSLRGVEQQELRKLLVPSVRQLLRWTTYPPLAGGPLSLRIV